MRRISTFLVLAIVGCLVSGNIFAQEKKVSSIENYSYFEVGGKAETPDQTTSQFYDEDGLMVMTINPYTKEVYNYNTDGSVASVMSYWFDSYSTNTWVFSSKTSYEYDEAGNMTRQNSLNESDEVTGYTLYENYINGYFQDRKLMSADGESVYYWEHFEYTFDANGNLVSQINSYKADEETTIILNKIEYTYSNDLLQKEEKLAYSEGEYVSNAALTYIKTYSYDTDGDLTDVSDVEIDRSGYPYYVDYAYNYNDYSASYQPTNLSVSAGEATNTAVLNWTAATSGDVTGYMVIVDNLLEGVVTGTTFTSATLINGEHTFAVVAVVNDAPSTISDIVLYSVADAGVLPATNTNVTNIGTYDENLYVNVTVSWDAPVTDSELVEYIVYYSNWYSVSTTETTATLSIESWLTIGSDENGDEYGLEVPIYVVAVYSTGTADASNTVVCIPYSGIANGIEDGLQVADVAVYPNPTSDIINFTDFVSVELYNLSGSMVKSSSTFVNQLNLSGISKGMYVAKLTDKQGKTKLTKVIIK